ncbi:alpha/beta fold hydrolase [Aureispira anguillae]|uniref:Alpha/beta hydrolase n=1 Tax=Aureispira anguillae TaxID=2864201 RepID=A0A915YIG4_9BACT|nr:alpha/beta hydrolase [Aureispira anguillae]BDS13609.1 alpha/beta hydrolase [Aureispira anguillae]
MSLRMIWILLILPCALMGADIKIEQIKANGLEFTCRTVGVPSDGPTVILLHGFPETSHMWEETMLHLHEKGFYCIAPDLRGYSKHARPKGVRNYAIKALAQDIIEIVAAKQIDAFHLIGHDWGSAIGWSIVGLYPEKVISWLAMSVPHLTALGNAAKYDPSQKKMSQYARVFQWHFLPEMILKGNDFKRLREACWYLSTPEQIEVYKSVFSQKRALTTCLHYYRKNWNKMLEISKDLNISAIKTPTTLIWGNKDTALGRKAVEDTVQYMKGTYQLVELDASHWLIQDKPKEVWKAMDAHFATYGN